MNIDLDNLTYDLEVDGELVRRTLAARTFETRGWATVLLVYEERDREGGWKPAKALLLRLRRMGEGWKKQSTVTLPGAHALAIAAELEAHRGALAGAAADEE